MEAASRRLSRGGTFNKAHNFLISEMIVPGSTYWNIGIGREPGDVEKDAEGIQTMKDMGRNLAWLLKKIQALAIRRGPRAQA